MTTFDYKMTKWQNDKMTLKMTKFYNNRCLIFSVFSLFRLYSDHSFKFFPICRFYLFLSIYLFSQLAWINWLYDMRGSYNLLHHSKMTLAAWWRHSATDLAQKSVDCNENKKPTGQERRNLRQVRPLPQRCKRERGKR